MEKSINMREVAKRAGVSVATVSRALRNPEKVSQEALKRVQQVTAELGYVYNASVGDVLTGRSTVLGLLVPSASNALFGETLHGIQDVAANAGYSVIQSTTRYDHEKEEALIYSLLQRRVHALIMTGMTDKTEALVERLAREERARIVVVWEKPKPDLPISYVGFDNRDAAKRMTEYLIGLGHRRVGLISGPFSRIARARHRLEGYREALESVGIEFDSDLVMERRPYLHEGQEAMEALLCLEDRPTAVFAASDLLAIGALKAAKTMGLSVPGDVSIAGFDDMDVVSYQDPPLTTIQIDAHRIGQLAAQIAMDPSGSPARNYCLPSDLVIRGSTGPAPAPRP